MLFSGGAYNGDDSANRYSPLTQINIANVSSLKLKWVFPISYFGLEVTPLASDGVLYVTGPNQVFALDALTGNALWRYSRPPSPGMVGDARLGTNRGVAILRDKVFFVTDNAHLLSLSRANGKLLWETPMAPDMAPDEHHHYGGTLAPLIVDNTVVVGVAGADEGIRGFVAAFKPDDGSLAWRRWTVPRRGEPGMESWVLKEPACMEAAQHGSQGPTIRRPIPFTGLPAIPGPTATTAIVPETTFTPTAFSRSMPKPGI